MIILHAHTENSLHLKINFARSAVADAVAEVEEKEERAYTMQTDHNIYLRFSWADLTSTLGLDLIWFNFYKRI